MYELVDDDRSKLIASTYFNLKKRLFASMKKQTNLFKHIFQIVPFKQINSTLSLLPLDARKLAILIAQSIRDFFPAILHRYKTNLTCNHMKFGNIEIAQNLTWFSHMMSWFEGKGKENSIWNEIIIEKKTHKKVGVKTIFTSFFI